MLEKVLLMPSTTEWSFGHFGPKCQYKMKQNATNCNGKIQNQQLKFLTSFLILLLFVFMCEKSVFLIYSIAAVKVTNEYLQYKQ